MSVLLADLSSSSRDEWEQTFILARDYTRSPALLNGEGAVLLCRAGTGLAEAAVAEGIPLVALEHTESRLALAFALRRVLKKSGALSVHTFDPLSLKSFALLRRFYSFRLIHSFASADEGRDRKRDASLRRADAVVLPGDDVPRLLLEAKVPDERIHTIYPIYASPHHVGPVGDVELPLAMPAADKSGGHFVFAAACALTWDKDVNALIQAIAYLQNMAIDLPPWEVRVAGNGPLFQELLTSAQTMGVAGRLALLGDQPRVAILEDAHAVVATSAEGRGDAPLVLDAWAMHLPVACTALSAHAAMGTDKEAFLLSPPAKPVALAGSMLRLLTEPETRTRLIKGGTEALAAFKPLGMARRYAALYSTLEQAVLQAEAAALAAREQAKREKAERRRAAKEKI